jgi:Tol biopolymer transport system component
VFFKIATPAGGDYRSKDASHREQIYAYDLAGKRFLFGDKRWGHPAWHPDSRTILNTPNTLWDSDSGTSRPMPDLPSFRGSHPSMAPSGDLFVTDYVTEVKGQWAVAVAEMRGSKHKELHRFDNSRGANSWRVSHPHPVFSADGRRIYFNVNDGPWTRLFVAESGGGEVTRR